MEGRWGCCCLGFGEVGLLGESPFVSIACAFCSSSGWVWGGFFSSSSRAGSPSSSGIGAAVWASGSGPGRVPVTMSASQSPRPPGAASTAVWGLYTWKICVSRLSTYAREDLLYTYTLERESKKRLLLRVCESKRLEASEYDRVCLPVSNY